MTLPNIPTEPRVELKRATEELKRIRAHEVYLFGSRATGATRPGSDVDIAVAGLPAAEFFAAYGRVMELLGTAVDLVDLDAPGPFTEHLRSHGQLRRLD